MQIERIFWLVNMKCVLVWLAVMTTTFHTSQARCRYRIDYGPGDFIVRGITETTGNLRGWIQICDNMTRWRAVCGNGWTIEDARVACRQLGYTGARHCTNSCYGGDFNLGIRNFACGGTETQLISCPTADTDDKCVRYAGITCWNPILSSTQSPRTCPMGTTCAPTTPANSGPTTDCTCPQATDNTTTSQPQTSTMWAETTEMEDTATDANTSMNTTITMATMTATAPTSVEGDIGAEMMKDSCPSLAALGGGLGGLCAILAILLVGVVIWSCHRRSGKSRLQERPMTVPHVTFRNPSYTPTPLSNTTPSVQYSSHGPRGTHSPSAVQPPSTAIYDVINEKAVLEEVPPYQGSGEGIYHVLEGPQEGGQCEEGEGGGGMDCEELEEGEYYLLGEVGEGEELTYEVPIPTIPAPAQPATQKVAEPMEYSTLQHQ